MSMEPSDYTDNQDNSQPPVDYSLLDQFANTLEPFQRRLYKAHLAVSAEYRNVEAARLSFEAFKAAKEQAAREEAAAQLAAEQERARQREIADRKRIEEESIQEIIDLSDQVPRLTIAFIGVKGSAATTTTEVHVASTFANITRSVCISGDFNPASGTSVDAYGKSDGRTIDIRGFLAKLDNLDTFNKVISELRPTRYGVRVIGANNIISTDDHLTGDEARRMLTVIGENCEYHFVDTANDITDEVTLAVVEKSDVLVFTANVGIQASLRQLSTGMETLRRHGFEDKVNNGVILISNMPFGHDYRDYRKYIHRVSVNNDVLQEYPFYGPFLQVPHDPIISRDTVVDLEALAWTTAQAYRTLMIEVLKQAPQFRAQPKTEESDSIVLRGPAL